MVEAFTASAQHETRSINRLAQRGIDHVLPYWQAGTYRDPETGQTHAGWWSPAYNADGQPIKNPQNGKPTRSFKNANSQADPHDAWANYPGFKPYILQPKSVKRAVSATGGLLYGAEGKADTASLWAAGADNALGFYGTSFVPDSLAADLTSWHVTRFIYYCHPDALKTAQKIVNLLGGSGIEVTITMLPANEAGRKAADLNDIWQAVAFERGAFWARLAELPHQDLQAQPVKTYERPAVTSRGAGDYRPYALQALANEAAILAGAASHRNDQLYQSAAALAGFIPHGMLTESEISAALEPVARDIGLTKSATRSTLRSGIDDGKQEPRDLSHLDRDRLQLSEVRRGKRAEYSAAGSLSGSLSGDVQPYPTTWPNGVPDALRAALAKYEHPSIAPVLELWHEAIRAGLADEGESLTLADLSDLAQSTGRGVTSDTIRHAVKLGADYFAVVCPPVLPLQESDLNNPPGQTTGKAAGRQTQPHKRAVYRRLSPIGDIYQTLLRRAWRRIVEKHFPIEGDDLTLAPIRELFANDPGTAAALDERYAALVDGQPELKFKLNAARAEYERLAASLHDPHSTPLPSGWKFPNAAEYAACFARAIVESRGGETQIGKPRWAAALGKSERRIKAIFSRAGIADIEDQTEEKPIRSAGDLPRNPGWFDKRLLSYEPGRAEPIAKFRDLKDSDSAARFVAAETARGHVVKLERQVANRQRIASDVQPEPKPRKVSTKVEVTDMKEPSQMGRILPKTVTPVTKRPPRRCYFGPGPDPAWRDRGILRLLDLVGSGRDPVDPDTGEILEVHTAAQALDVLLGKPVTTWIERSDPDRDDVEPIGSVITEPPAHETDPILDFCVTELGGTVGSITTIEHPGAALWETYRSFADLNKRDDWYQDLDAVDREDLLYYRYHVLRSKTA